MKSNESNSQKTPLRKIVTAWTIVAIPLGWGVYQSVVKSLPLFQISGAPAPGGERASESVQR
jgi:hypothetical protein